MAVISLRTGEAIDSKYAKQLVGDVSTEIEQGLVAAVVIAIVYRDGASDFSMSIDCDFNPDTLIGVLERAKADVISKTTIQEDIG